MAGCLQTPVHYISSDATSASHFLYNKESLETGAPLKLVTSAELPDDLGVLLLQGALK